MNFNQSVLPEVESDISNDYITYLIPPGETLLPKIPKSFSAVSYQAVLNQKEDLEVFYTNGFLKVLNPDNQNLAIKVFFDSRKRGGRFFVFT